jgi:hypothetical protein
VVSIISGATFNYLLVPAEAAFNDQASNQTERCIAEELALHGLSYKQADYFQCLSNSGTLFCMPQTH